MTEPRTLCPIAAAAAAVFVISCFTATDARAGQIEGHLPEDVLIIGNSLVRGLKKPLKDFLKADGSKVKIQARAPAGWRLSKHAYRRSTEKAIRSRDWDYVFLAEQSDGIWDERYPGARSIVEKIEALTSAQTVFLMTWRDRGDPALAYNSLRGEPGGHIGYVPISDELDLPLAPAGWAFRRSIAEDELPFDLWQDGHHLARRGSYLVACVMYAVMTGNSPVGLPALRKISELEARYMQFLAAATVFDPQDDWNLDSNRALR